MNLIKRLNLTFVFLLLITCLSLFLRIYLQGVSPKGALIDEAHFGYLAYSILETGKDEHGVALPLNFRGFGDDKLPMQTYLMVPIVKLFGLNTVTIRYPSILVGTFLPLIFFLIAKEIGLKKRWPLMTAFLVAVSPWTFFLSRFGFESNLALFFFSLGYLFLLKSIKSKKTVFTILSSLFLSFTWYAYIAYRPISIIWSLFTIFFAKKNLGFSWKKIAIFLTVFLISVFPLLQPKVVGNNTTRLKQVGIFSDPGIAMEIDENRNFCTNFYSTFICYATYNKLTLTISRLANRYLSSFSPQFLVTEGIEQNRFFLNSKNYGQFVWPLYLFFVTGLSFVIYQAFKDKKNLNYQSILFGLLFAPVPAVLVGDPQKVRISTFFPFVVLTILFGMAFIFSQIEKQISSSISKLTFFIFFVLLIALTGAYYVDYYSVHTIKNGHVYQSYLPDLFSYLKTIEDDQTIINLYPFYSDPIMFYAFYNQTDPRFYQQQAVLGELEESGFQHTVKMGNIYAKPISAEDFACEASRKQQEAIYATDRHLDLPILYQGKEENGVHTLVYVYDLEGLVNNTHCR